MMARRVSLGFKGAATPGAAKSRSAVYHDQLLVEHATWTAHGIPDKPLPATQLDRIPLKLHRLDAPVAPRAKQPRADLGVAAVGSTSTVIHCLRE